MFEKDQVNWYAQCSDDAVQQDHAMHLSKFIS